MINLMRNWAFTLPSSLQAQRLAEPRVIELKERDGVIITQPDG